MLINMNSAKDSTNEVFLKTIIYLWVATAMFFYTGCQQPNKQLPNIVIILTDDQGYGDLGIYGATQFSTPHLDQMAADGMRFTHFYAAQAVCSAARAVLLTGL